MPSAESDPHVLEPGHLPTPFTAAEIRSGCPAGRSMVLNVETADGDPYRRVIRFLTADEQGAEQETQNLNSDGTALGPPERNRSTWLDLQSHASFPAAGTTVERELVDIPLGRVDSLRYTTTVGNAGHTFWFDLARPGMPVKIVTHESGRVVRTITMIEDRLRALES